MLTRFVAPPLQIKPASLGFDLISIFLQGRKPRYVFFGRTRFFDIYQRNGYKTAALAAEKGLHRGGAVIAHVMGEISLCVVYYASVDEIENQKRLLDSLHTRFYHIAG